MKPTEHPATIIRRDLRLCDEEITTIAPLSPDALCDGAYIDGAFASCNRYATHYNEITRRCDTHAIDGWHR